MMIIDPYRFGAGGLPYTPPLDANNAAAAYSIRKLRTAYEGSSMRVVNDSDEGLDIGFGDDGLLDTAAILAHVGSGGGYIQSWYDQSGNGYDLRTESKSQAPIIAATGSIVQVNGLPAIEFDGANDDFRDTTGNGLVEIFKNIGYGSSFGVYKIENTTSSDFILHLINRNSGFGSARHAIYGNLVNGKLSLAGRRLDSDSNQFIDSASNYSSAQTLVTGIIEYANSNAYLYVDGALEASTTSFQTAGLTSNTDSSVVIIGADAVRYLNGFSQELIFYNTDIAADRAAIEANINSYFSIY